MSFDRIIFIAVVELYKISHSYKLKKHLRIVRPEHKIYESVLKTLQLSSKAQDLSVFFIILLYMKEAKERRGVRAY